jgi:hypothetical protein
MNRFVRPKLTIPGLVKSARGFDQRCTASICAAPLRVPRCTCGPRDNGDRARACLKVELRSMS